MVYKQICLASVKYSLLVTMERLRGVLGSQLGDRWWVVGLGVR